MTVCAAPHGAPKPQKDEEADQEAMFTLQRQQGDREAVLADSGLGGHQRPGGGGGSADDLLSELGSALDELESNLAEGVGDMPFGPADGAPEETARSPEEEAREYQLRLQAEAEAMMNEGREGISKVPDSFKNMKAVDGDGMAASYTKAEDGDSVAASYRSKSEAAANKIRIGLSLGDGSDSGGQGDVSVNTDQFGQSSTADPDGMVPLVPAPSPRQTTESLLGMLDNFHDAWDPYQPTGIPMFWRKLMHEALYYIVCAN